ncbi:MAG: diguanylate cyclase [Alkalibacterium sp.]|nr:diguanylate cyclase [Alkalibacterium sp.]
MTAKHRNKAVLVFIFIYTVFYYGWITLWNANTYILTAGGNVLSIVGPLIATLWLIKAIRRSPRKERAFWLLLAMGTFSYFLAESVWLIYETVMKLNVPYPGIPDIFYVMNSVLYLSAFVYKLKTEKKHLSIATFIFDIFLVMTVYSTFFWYFLIKPVIENNTAAAFELGLSLFYPLIDLALLFFIVVYFFNCKRVFHRYTSLYLIAGILLQITADIGFMLLQNSDAYTSGSWLDPLFILGTLLIGYTGLLQQEAPTQESQELLVDKADGNLRMLFPYIYVSILFIYMIVNASTMNEVTVGAGLTIVIIIARQLIVLNENKQLIGKYETQTKDLLLSEERYKSLFSNHPDAVFSLDLKGHVISVNKKGAELAGVAREKLISRSVMPFIDDEHKEQVRENFYKTRNGSSQHYQFTITNSFGRLLYISVTHIPIMVKEELVGVFAIAQDITQNKLNEQRIHYLAYHDPLTNLANRTHFEEHLADRIKHSDPARDLFAVLFLDLNDFKLINDTYGHALGDELLSEIGQRIHASIDEDEHGARLGGDEFTLLLTRPESRSDIDERTRRLKSDLSRPYLIKGRKLYCIPSIGCAIYPDDGTSSHVLLDHADTAMYARKRTHKNVHINKAPQLAD